MMEPEVITLARQLIQKPSFTPDDAGCITSLMNRMSGQGFKGHHHRFGMVDNVLIWHGNKPGPSLLFLGHTDVVPTGDPDSWDHPPLSGHVENGVLYGRGVADMKGAVAAMVLAMEKFVGQNASHKGKVALMLTSDEEGEAKDGIQKFMPLIAQQHHFDFCLVGEPSSSQVVGDTVRVGRRGSLHMTVKVLGKQGHVAYPQHADNPVFSAALAVEALGKHQWDQGNADFPPTSFQISNVSAGTGAANVIPGSITYQGNFRYSPESSQPSLEKQVKTILDGFGLSYELTWQLSGEPFYCQNKHFRHELTEAIVAATNIEPIFNTAGGTSDGRFVAPYGIATMELGLVNKTIHRVNECQEVKNLLTLEGIYLDLISRLLK